MFLKSLEIVGFKSFAEQTGVVFHPGMTAIVGPNGCGKSNVLDSVRWVLGEQSAKALRGSTMQDVIFNGSDSRKPLGMAEVSLTFSDCEQYLGSDFHEVRVTRRVFKDGQSEYELNKAPCRLRDVQQLFMDTGIGRTAYSIMEQGKIDAILSSKPEDRRAIFEEAAGITKFKSQRKEALRKLELTEANLLRVQDIIREVARQINSLQRQAAKAKRYRELSDKLREMDTKLSVHQFEELNASAEAEQHAILKLQEEYTALEVELSSGEVRQRELRAELESLEQASRANEQQRQRLESDAASARQKIGFNQSRIQELTTLIENARREASGTEEKVRIQGERLTQIENEGTKLAEVRQQEEQTLIQAQESLRVIREQVTSLQQNRQQLEQAIAQGSRRLEAARGRMAMIEAEHRTYLVRVEKLKEDQVSWDNLRAELDANGQAIALRETEKQLHATATIEKLRAEQSGGAALENSLQTSRKEYETLRSHRAEMQARLEALRQLAESNVGMSEAAKALLKARRGQGILAALLESITVTPGFELAIETCLGELADALVLDANASPAEIKAAFSGSGKVVLLSPSSGNSFVQPSLQDERAALQKISVADSMGPLRAFLAKHLAGWYVVANAEEAAKIQSEIPWAKIVSQQGEVWHPDGWLIYGSAKDNHHSLLTRKNEIAELEKQMASLEQELAAAEQRVAEIQESVASQTDKITQAREESDRANAELNAVRYETELHNRRNQELLSRQSSLDRERQQLSSKETSTTEEQQKLTDECEQIIRANQDASTKVEGLLVQIDQTAKEIEQRSQEVVELRVKVSAATQQLDGFRREQESVHLRIDELKEFAAKCARDIAEYENRIGESQKIIHESETSVVTIHGQVETLTQEAQGLAVKKTESSTRLAEADSALSQHRKRAMELQSLRSKHEITYAELRLKLTTLTERIRTAYQIEISEIAANPPQPPANETPELQQPTDWQLLEQEVTAMRTKLESMGPVNMEAITEYEELEQRHKFLQDQERDLTTARQQLVDSIKQINETTKVLFSETFQKVQENFSKVYVELFGGGRASITLTEESDPLESGIDIIARPPGKQQQSITLLSGGEKTMTAVALLFAIYMVKPSPFCILDEMDAPLDESNIGRFIQMLQRFVQQSQFIVITHNKKTIAAADVLYGVTMEEQGVSKIVSARLSRKEESPLFNGKEKKEEKPEIPAAEPVVVAPEVAAPEIIAPVAAAPEEKAQPEPETVSEAEPPVAEEVSPVVEPENVPTESVQPSEEVSSPEQPEQPEEPGESEIK